jgi:hypothetical protein
MVAGSPAHAQAPPASPPPCAADTPPEFLLTGLKPKIPLGRLIEFSLSVNEEDPAIYSARDEATIRVTVTPAPDRSLALTYTGREAKDGVFPIRIQPGEGPALVTAVWRETHRQNTPECERVAQTTVSGSRKGLPEAAIDQVVYRHRDEWVAIRLKLPSCEKSAAVSSRSVDPGCDRGSAQAISAILGSVRRLERPETGRAFLDAARTSSGFPRKDEVHAGVPSSIGCWSETGRSKAAALSC